jgi:4'-phosphopantetheinyl transferase
MISQPMKLRIWKPFRSARAMCTWDVPRGPVELKSGEIHVWRVDVHRNLDALPALTRTLAPDESAKAGEFRLDVHRNRYIIAHGAVRAILARYLRTTASEPVFRYGSQGKPELASGVLHFNMSHSHDLVLCAISRTGHVGVDVERVRPGAENDLAGYVSSSALRFLGVLPRPTRRRALFQGWTRMEACLKAGGQGLTLGPETFEVLLDPSNPVRLPPLTDMGQARPWWLYDLCPRRGYLGAVATRRADCRLRYWQWQAQDTWHSRHSM